MNRMYLLSIIIFQLAIKSFAQTHVDISISKNFELLYALQLQSKMDSIIIANHYAAFPLTTQLNFELKLNYLRTFALYKSCSQVKYFNELITKGFIFNGPFAAVLMTDSSLNITNSCWLQQLPYPQTVKDSIKLFLKKLKEFKNISNFDMFYQQNKSIYDSIISQQEKKVPVNELINSIEHFFGWALPGYHVILVTTMWPGGISIEYKKNCTDSLGEVFIFLGPKHVKDDLPDFGTLDEYRSVVLHEFIHAFIKPYCLKYKTQIEQYSDLYKGNKDVFQNNACPDWFSAVNEMFTRTVEIIIANETTKEKVKEAINYQSDQLGFRYIPVLYDAFKQYEFDKENHVSLDTIFQEIIFSFDKMGNDK